LLQTRQYFIMYFNVLATSFGHFSREQIKINNKLLLCLTETGNFIIVFQFMEVFHFSHNNKDAGRKGNTHQQLHSDETRNGRSKAHHLCECACRGC